MAAVTQPRPAVPSDDEAIGSQPIYVWEVPVRVTHWLIVISIVVLSVTGMYIHGPFFVPSSPLEASSQMASVRFWHEIFAIVFSLSVAVRFYWGFVGNSFSSWSQIIPHRRDQFYWLKEMGRYYSFRRRHPVPYTGHNHLAGLAYTVVSVGLFAQVLTGLLLFGWIMPAGPFHVLFGWGNAVPGGLQFVRFMHNLLTFLFLAFAIHHVYSAILVDIEERIGVMSSMFSGYKNIRTEQTVEALGLVGHAPEEKARALAEERANGNRANGKGNGADA
ncbi:MAG: Ni/Fe-hydrogenase, b-type cytochrome subunit [Chloroflexi bacterium]|nr:Ni/Fe-hydrogenase, b-type cytochrome subunit [Chloroflexota bacterium]